MKTIKLHVGSSKPVKNGWIHLRTHKEFQDILYTVNLKDISAINFNRDLDDDEDDIVGWDGADCVMILIELAHGGPIPQCMTDDTDIEHILNHYIQSYKYENYCGVLVKN